MPRITLDVSILTYQYILQLKEENGSSISFEAVRLVEQAIKERNRKKKLPLQNGTKDIPL
jgi:hypothetical protein